MSIPAAAPSSLRGPVGVALIGAGNISKQYLDNLTAFPDLKVHVIADLFEDAAEARAKEYGIAEWGGVDKALSHPDVEITGTEATLSLPDPNYFDGDIRLWRAGDEDWTTIPATGPANGRGMGVLDMARSLRAGVPHGATGELAYHVLDRMVSITESIESGTFVDVASSAPASAALPEDWAPETATLGGAA